MIAQCTAYTAGVALTAVVVFLIGYAFSVWMDRR